MTTLRYNALCTSDEVRDFLSGTLSVDDMDRIISLINSTSKLFENYCCRTIVANDFTEYYDGGYSKLLFLDNFPINTINSVYLVEDLSTETIIPSGEYKIVDSIGIYYPSVFPLGIQNIKVSYEAGYDEVPEDIKQVCIEEVVRVFKRRDRLDVTSISKPEGNYNVISDPSLPRTKNVLDYYRAKFL